MFKKKDQKTTEQLKELRNELFQSFKDLKEGKVSTKDAMTLSAVSNAFVKNVNADVNVRKFEALNGGEI